MPRIKIALPETFPFQTEMPVRITDINYGQHLGNNMMLAFLHEARVRFLKQYGYSELDIEGVGIIMADTGIVFKAETLYGETLVIEVAITDVHRRGCDVVYRVTDKATGKDVAHAKTGIVFFDYQKKQLMPVPEGFRTRFAS